MAELFINRFTAGPRSQLQKRTFAIVGLTYWRGEAFGECAALRRFS